MASLCIVGSQCFWELQKFSAVSFEWVINIFMLESLQALVVNLGSDYAPGDQLAFYRQTDLDLLSPDSKAQLKDVVSYDEDGAVDTDEAHAATVLLDKLVSARCFEHR